MSSDLTNFIKSVKERLAKATPGPWRSYVWPNFPRIDEYENCIRIEGDKCIAAFCFEDKISKDYELIANAPSDLKLLLEIVELQNSGLKEYADPEGSGHKTSYYAGMILQDIDALIKKHRGGD